jgi:hypothetical protein
MPGFSPTQDCVAASRDTNPLFVRRRVESGGRSQELCVAQGSQRSTRRTPLPASRDLERVSAAVQHRTPEGMTCSLAHCILGAKLPPAILDGLDPSTADSFGTAVEARPAALPRQAAPGSLASSRAKPPRYARQRRPACRATVVDPVGCTKLLDAFLAAFAFPQHSLVGPFRSRSSRPWSS